MGGKYTTTHQDIKMCGSEYFKVEDGLVFVVKSPTYNATGPVEPVKVPAPVETINAPAPGQTCQHVMMTKAESVSYVAANRDTLVPLSKLSVPQLRKLSEYLLGGLEKL